MKKIILNFIDSSLTLVTSEFGTFMGRNERYLQMFLTDMWDAKEFLQS